MSIQSSISLIAGLAYIPLFIVLSANRPWQRQKKIFALFLISMMLWSFGGSLFRSELLIDYKMLLAKAVLCFLLAGITLLHYFLRSYCNIKTLGNRLVAVAAGIVLVAIIALIPERISMADGTVPIYGPWVLIMAVYALGLLGYDIYAMIVKLRSTVDPHVHNQLVYLIVGVSVAVVLSAFSATTAGLQYPWSQVGNLLMALLMTYAVVRHQLLDLRLVLRWGLTTLSMLVIGAVAYLLLYLTGRFLLKINVGDLFFLLSIGVALFFGFIIFQMRRPLAVQIDKMFFRDSYAYRKELHNFAKIGIKGVLNLDEFGKELLNLFCGAIRCRQAFLLLPQEKTGDFYIRFSAPSNEDRPSFIMKSDSPVMQWIRRENTYLSKEKLDVEAEFKGLWKEERDSILQLNIQLFLPIVSRGNVIGLLALGEKWNKSRYTLEDIDLSERILGNVATSLEKEYLQDQLRKREQELSLINRLAGVISSSLDVQQVYDAFVAQLKGVVEVDYTAVALIEGNDLFRRSIERRRFGLANRAKGPHGQHRGGVGFDQQETVLRDGPVDRREILDGARVSEARHQVSAVFASCQQGYGTRRPHSGKQETTRL
jgi:hypothetical protein